MKSTFRAMLCCLIQVAEHGEIIVKIDERQLRLKQFGKLLVPSGGQGMHIEFLPTDELHHRPVLQAGEPR